MIRWDWYNLAAHEPIRNILKLANPFPAGNLRSQIKMSTNLAQLII